MWEDEPVYFTNWVMQVWPWMCKRPTPWFFCK